MKHRAVFVFAAILLAGCFAYGATAGTVTFTLDFPHSDPEHYSITVQSDGHAKYVCTGRVSRDSEDTETYETEFVFSDATRAKIFDLAAQAHYFSGKVDSGNKKLAFTGAKKLTYTDGQRTSSANYNFSNMAAVQQLTTLFQSLAGTLEYGRHLAYFHRYQKLALDEELKRMELQARSGELAEVSAVDAILQDIYEDNTVINVVRARAQRLREMAKAGSSSR
jgi:hypothetical protein